MNDENPPIKLNAETKELIDSFVSQLDGHITQYYLGKDAELDLLYDRVTVGIDGVFEKVGM